MVLQQKSLVTVWGESSLQKTITLTVSWNKKEYQTTSDEGGKWRFDIATPKAGGPYKVTIDDGEPITLSNVMVGEVWLCSSQSNMDSIHKSYIHRL